MTQKLKEFYKSYQTIPKLFNIADDSMPDLKMDQYETNLEFLIHDGKNIIRQPIKVEQIFDNLGSQVSVNKVLVKGPPGIGKNTLMNCVTYKWATQELFAQKFKYVFRLPLKSLANLKLYGRNFTNLNILMRLILEPLYDKTNKPLLTQEQVKVCLNQNDKVLLILDGYDQISGLRLIHVKSFIESIFSQYSKYAVMMTSKSNQIGELQSRFQRTIGLLGLNQDRVNAFIDRCKFQNKEQSQLLKKELESNIYLANLLKTPLNLNIFCFLITKNYENMEHFKEEFPLSKLYEETFVWLAHAQNDRSSSEQVLAKYITVGDVFSKSHVRAIKNAAYIKFIDGVQIVSTVDIKSQFKQNKEVSYPYVVQFGLIRQTGNIDRNKKINKDDPNGRIFSFVHSTFQQFLTARFITQQLCEKTKEFSNLIGKIRNQPRFFMVMKFLSGMINTEQNNLSSAQGSENVKKLIKKAFWQAAVCNVDGFLEFSVNNKARLFMNLLGQCKVDNLKVNQVKNIELIRRLIDDVTIKNIELWREIILQSGYKSDRTQTKLKELTIQKIEELNKRLIPEEKQIIHVTRQGKILFNDRVQQYDVLKNSNDRRQFQTILRNCLTSNSKIVEQYKAFKAEFPNNGQFLDKSASDFENASSMIKEANYLNQKSMVLSYIEPLENKQQKFCLVEKRNQFGDVLVYKIEPNRIKPFHTVHPLKNDQVFRQKVLGEIADVEYKIFTKIVPVQVEAQIQNLVQNRKKNNNLSNQSLLKSINQNHVGQSTQIKFKKWQVLGFKQTDSEVLNIRASKLENKFEQIDKKVKQMQTILQKGGVNDIVAINQAIEEMQKNIKNPNLIIYYKVFYWSFNSYMESYINCESGIQEVNTRHDQQNSLVEAGFKAVGNTVLKLAQGIPVIGDFIGYLDGIVDYLADEYYAYKFQNKKNAVTKIIKARTMSKDALNRIIQKLAIKIIECKKEVIENPTKKEEDSIVSDFMRAFQNQVKGIKDFVIEPGVAPYAEEEVVAQMATKDIGLLLSFMYKNSDKIAGDTSKDLATILAESLKAEEDKLVQKLKGNKQKVGAVQKGTDSKVEQVKPIDPSSGQAVAAGGCCFIYRVKMRYDNELLNHPYLLKQLSQNGITIQQILQLGNICNEIMKNTDEM